MACLLRRTYWPCFPLRVCSLVGHLAGDHSCEQRCGFLWLVHVRKYCGMESPLLALFRMVISIDGLFINIMISSALTDIKEFYKHFMFVLLDLRTAPTNGQSMDLGGRRNCGLSVMNTI